MQIQKTSPLRIAAVDRLRGWVIVLMALDHARGFFQPAGLNPVDLANTTLPFFFMRWITHLCAPTFVFLAGVSCWLAARGGRPLPPLRRHLLARGLLLMLLEVTWVSFSWTFGFEATHLGVLWAIGGALVLLSGLVGRSPKVIGFLGLGLTLLFAATDVNAWHPIIDALCRPQRFMVMAHPVHSVYVIAPWFGVMALGYGLAPWFTRTTSHWKMSLMGLAMVTGFVALRWANGFGDPAAWALQPGEGWRTVLGFINPSKYPPSLLLSMMTLGVVFLITPILTRLKGFTARVLDRCGQAALFFYLLHLPLLHVAGWCYAQFRYGSPHIPSGQPLSLGLIVTVWVAVCLLLTPLCRQWRVFKQTHGARWSWVRYF